MRIIDVSKPINGWAVLGRKFVYVDWHNGERSRISRNKVTLKDGILWLKQSES